MFEIPKSYSLVKEYDLKDIDSKGYLLKHNKSGARLALIDNDDDNKVFYIAFRTTPKDSTGVAHILEHSVLCGSKKYPLKDPFVELAKGSLNTFLNAMTFPDKTMYPIASENDKDFNNLMDVYMDAVFNPNIYENEKIFLQEGWHYELSDPEGELSINGVVYNEMKGAYSSPDDCLEMEIFTRLFPDTPYAFEYGGKPEDIPNLTYEDFLAFHKRYYHPSNSYIYIYGNCDFNERLSYLDKEYLSKYETIDPKTEIGVQEPFSSPKEYEKDYAVATADDLKDNTYFSHNYVVGDICDPLLTQAFSVLDYALLNSPGAPVREALIKKGVGKDIIGGFNNGTKQTYFNIGVKGSNPDKKEKFQTILREALKDVIEKGIDKQSILAAINVQEFSFREADYGSYPKGLFYGLDIMDSWLYDENAPFTYLDPIPFYDRLKELSKTDYFENLVRDYLYENKNSVMITLLPKDTLTKEIDKKTAEKLASYKAGLSKNQVMDLIETNVSLKEYQETPTDKEDINKLPTLKREDLRKEIRPFKNRLETLSGTKVLFHDLNTNGINYLNLCFDIRDIKLCDVSKLSLMTRMLGLLDTKNHTYADLSNEINIKTGGIYTHLQIIKNKEKKICFNLIIDSKFLKENIGDAIDLSLEIALDTDYSNEERIKELLNKEIVAFKSKIAGAGHMIAVSRASARHSESSYLNELINGIEYYNFLLDFEKNFDEKIKEYKEDCKRLTKEVFKKSGLLISETGKAELTKEIEPYVSVITDRLSDLPFNGPTSFGLLNTGNEGFKSASTVSYVARCGSFSKENDLEYNGALEVLRTALSYDYLWNNVRVMGGAYGCMAAFRRTGDSYFVSYRDPNLGATNQVFEGIYRYAKDFNCDEGEMTKYVIGTISTMDTPLTPCQEGERSLTAYFTGTKDSDNQKYRDQVLNASTQSINGLSDYIKNILDMNLLCVVGSEASITKDEDLFDKVASLS